jgi:hypothetical protein
MKTYLLKLGFTFALVGIFSMNQLWAFTAVTSGDWTNAATWGGVAPGANVTGQDIIIPNGITVTMDIDVTFNGLLNAFTVDGILNTSTNNGLVMESGAFGGDGDVNIQRLEFNLLSTSSFTGTLILKELVNDGALVTFTSDITVSDTLNLLSGTITLNTGANLAVQTNATVRRDDGSIVIGGGVFNSGSNYHVLYVGSSKTTGVEINSTTIQNVYLQMDNNSQTVTLGSDLEVNGTLQMNMGILSIGSNELTISGNLNVVSGSMFSGSATSMFTIESSSAINSGIEFTGGSSLDEFSIDHTGTGNVKLMSSVTIISELELINGDLSLETGSGLAMSAGTMVHIENGNLVANGGSFTGTASYDVEYMGTTNTTGLELTGTGLNDVEINLTGGGDQINMTSNATIAGYVNLRMGKLHMNGYDLVLNGTFDQEPGATIIGNNNSNLEMAIAISGDDTIYFDGSNQNIETFTLDISGAGDLVLGSVLRIHDELNMVNGRIVLMNYDLIIEQGSSITNYSDTKYIVTEWSGKLQQYVNISSPYLVYPVGTDNSYSPASIIQGSGATAGNIKVGCFDGVFTGGTEFAGYNSASTASVVNRTWEIEAAGGVTVAMDLKLGWVTSSEVNGFDRTNSYISHYMTGDWDSQASASAVAGLNNTFELTRTGVTSLSPFAVADVNAELIVEDEEVSNINLFPNPCTEIVNIQYSNVADQYMYQITDISGKTYAVVSNGSNTFDVSGLDAGFYFLRMTNIATQKTTVKEFIKK